MTLTEEDCRAIQHLRGAVTDNYIVDLFDEPEPTVRYHLRGDCACDHEAVDGFVCRHPDCNQLSDTKNGRATHESFAHPDHDFTEARFHDGYEYTDSGCWEWTGVVSSVGYGMLAVSGDRPLAHRVSYRLHHGEIPDGMYVLHDCDNPPCVNPDHLHLGDQQQNIDEAIERGRMDRKGEKHHNAKLTWEKVNDIRSRYDSGETIDELELDYDVSYSTIHNVVHENTWTEA